MRRFRPSDLTPVRTLIHRTIDACYSGVYPSRAVEFFKQFHSEHEIIRRSQKGEILVARSHGTVVATGALVGSEILGVFVAPEFQGRGYGKAVMRELEDKASARGCAEVTLSVSLPSKGFYEALGYELFEECSIDVGQGQRLEFWKARRAIASRRR